MKSTKNQALEKLKSNGYKLTPQRIVVLDALAESRGCLTPAELYERVQRERPETGLVTIYRTLEIFANLDIICEIHSTGNGAAYMLRKPLGHHHHLICSSCGIVEDFSDCDLDDLEQRLSLLTGFDIERHLLELVGICHECQQKELV